MFDRYRQLYDRGQLQRGLENVLGAIASLGQALESVENSREHVAFSEATCVAFFYGVTEDNELCFESLFIPVEDAKCSAHDFAGVFVTALLHPRCDEAIERWGEVYIACGHCLHLRSRLLPISND